MHVIYFARGGGCERTAKAMAEGFPIVPHALQYAHSIAISLLKYRQDYSVHHFNAV